MQTYFFSLDEFQYATLLDVFGKASAMFRKIAAHLRTIEEPIYAEKYDEDATRLDELYNVLSDAGNRNVTQYFFKFDLDDNASSMLCHTLIGEENVAADAAKTLREDGKEFDAIGQEQKAQRIHDLNVILGTRRRNHG